MDQQRSKIGVPALADPEDPGFAAGGGLLGYPTQPGRQLATVGKTFTVADRGEPCRGNEWADAGNLGQSAGQRVGSVDRLNALGDIPHLAIELGQVTRQGLE